MFCLNINGENTHSFPAPAWHDVHSKWIVGKRAWQYCSLYSLCPACKHSSNTTHCCRAPCVRGNRSDQIKDQINHKQRTNRRGRARLPLHWAGNTFGNSPSCLKLSSIPLQEFFVMKDLIRPHVGFLYFTSVYTLKHRKSFNFKSILVNERKKKNGGNNDNITLVDISAWRCLWCSTGCVCRSSHDTERHACKPLNPRCKTDPPWILCTKSERQIKS